MSLPDVAATIADLIGGDTIYLVDRLTGDIERVTTLAYLQAGKDNIDFTHYVEISEAKALARSSEILTRLIAVGIQN